MTPEMGEIIVEMTEASSIRGARDGAGNANTLTLMEAVDFAKRANREGREAVYRQVGLKDIDENDVVLILSYQTVRTIIEATVVADAEYRQMIANPVLPLAASRILSAAVNALQDARISMSRACERVSDKS